MVQTSTSTPGTKVPESKIKTYLLGIDSEVSQIWVEPVKYRLDGSVILKENKDECEGVENGDAKDEAPESRMRARKGSVWEGQQRDDEEEEENTAGRRPEVVLKVGVIARKGRVEDGHKGGDEEGDRVGLVEKLQ